MKAVVLAYKVLKGAGVRQLSEVRSGMKGKVQTAAAFKAVIEMCGGAGLPWKEMGAPEELPLGLGVAQILNDEDGSESDEGDCDGRDDAEDEDLEGVELEALGDVLDGVVASIGGEADDELDELSAVDAADSPEDLREVLECELRRGTRVRAARQPMDL